MKIPFVHASPKPAPAPAPLIRKPTSEDVTALCDDEIQRQMDNFESN